jgi:hypothetical protein
LKGLEVPWDWLVLACWVAGLKLKKQQGDVQYHAGKNRTQKNCGEPWDNESNGKGSWIENRNENKDREDNGNWGEDENLGGENGHRCENEDGNGNGNGHVDQNENENEEKNSVRKVKSHMIDWDQEKSM